MSLNLSEDVQTDMNKHLSCIESLILRETPSVLQAEDSAPRPLSIDEAHTSRYLGQTSDFHFIDRSRGRLASTESEDTGIERVIRCYDQAERLQTSRPSDCFLKEAPCWSDGRKLLGVYFSTIHQAYPFLPKSLIISRYKKIKSGSTDPQVSSAWMALIYGVLAIGAYYNSFIHQTPSPSSSSSQSRQLHKVYFQRSVILSDINKLEASSVQIAVLLVQCFYLLVTSNTDRCWITLGVAVRLAHILGLHVGYTDPEKKTWGYMAPQSQRAEIRRRTWYSLYVLDRLVSLQVGRPPAISDNSFNVARPSNADDESHDWESSQVLVDSKDPSPGDYFLQMIDLSTIIGHALQELNKPPESVDAQLSRSQTLDGELSLWRDRLPSPLRFNKIQFLDKLSSFKKQRNMLAIKYHHLRALIYRPFLDRGHSFSAAPQLVVGHSSSEEVVEYGNRCKEEARQIARLFHNVTEHGQLALEYPLWQLISCVVCAGSILIVSEKIRASTRQSASPSVANPQDEDTAICLKVLDALSRDSDGAAQARDMLTALHRSPIHKPRIGAASQIPTEGRDTGAKVPSLQQQNCAEHAARPWPTDWEPHFPPESEADYAWLGVGDENVMWPAWSTGSNFGFGGPLETMRWSNQVVNSLINPPGDVLDAIADRDYDVLN